MLFVSLRFGAGVTRGRQYHTHSAQRSTPRLTPLPVKRKYHRVLGRHFLPCTKNPPTLTPAISRASTHARLTGMLGGRSMPFRENSVLKHGKGILAQGGGETPLYGPGALRPLQYCRAIKEDLTCRGTRWHSPGLIPLPAHGNQGTNSWFFS